MEREQLIAAMKQVFADAPYGVEHTLRVLGSAEAILDGEQAGPQLSQTVTAAAILHDIGALEAARKHGSMDGPYQEQEGPPIARQIMQGLGFDPAQIERVCFIVGHHHSPDRIDGLDFQILWEADLLDNLEYGEAKPAPAALAEMIQAQFKTTVGRALAVKRLSGG